MIILETNRLYLRNFIDADLQSMYAINQDPAVMEYFSGLQDLESTRQFITKVKNHFDEYGFSLYATIRKDNQEFIGFIGLLTTDFKAHFTPAIEIGWRLSSQHWEQGFATEGAKAVVDYAFNHLNLPEIVSFTVYNNKKSRHVMQKIGLYHNIDNDFDHPKVEHNDNLKKHVLYRLTKYQYQI